MNNKKFLVTGADGFIGSHLVEELVKSGQDVRAFVAYNSFNSWGWLDSTDKEIINSVEIVAGDIRDQNGVHKAVEGCDVVLHLAALIAIPFSYNSPNTYIETNILGTLNVLQAAKNCGGVKVIQTSTSEVYGTAKYVPIDENHPLNGQSPYSASKIGADQIAYSFFSSFDLPVTIVRPFNVYGPRQSARAIIPSVITQILNGKEVIQLGSLSPTRDFTYVLDTVRGFIAAANSENGVGQVINLSSNFEISIGDLVVLIANALNKNVDVISSEERIRPKNSEVHRLWGDNKKAYEMIGWKPSHIGDEGLQAGIRKTISWFEDEKNLRLFKHNIYNV